MAQADGYDASLAAELEKLWRDTMLAGATRGIEDAVARQIEPLRSLIDAAKTAQASQFKDLEARIAKLEGIDQRLAGLIGQIDGGTQQFTAAAAQLGAVQGLVGQLEQRTAKLGQLDAHLAALEHRASHPDTLAQIRDIVEAEGEPEQDRIQQLRQLIGQLQGAPPLPPVASSAGAGTAGWTGPEQPNANPNGGGAPVWPRFKRWANRNPIALGAIAMGVLALVLLGLAAPQIKALVVGQQTAAAAPELTDPGGRDEDLIRAGWAVLKAKAPEMARQVEEDCGVSPCDIVALLENTLATGSNRPLAEAVLQLRKPIAGETAPDCDYPSFNAMLKEARSPAARPQALRACVRNAQLVDGRADGWDASNWNDRLRVYLIAIGSRGELGEVIDPVSSAAALPAAPPAAGPSAAPSATRTRAAPSAGAAAPRSEAAAAPPAAVPSEPAPGPAT